MHDPFRGKIINELLQIKKDGFLYHRESRTLEFKENFNHAGWDEYLKDFAALANNIGGYLIFGIQNNPRAPSGLDGKHAKMFKDIDEEYISGEINKLFSPSINWSKKVIVHQKKFFGVFFIEEAIKKPIIAKKDEGVIKNGEIYYRYAGRSQKIEFAELNSIIHSMIEIVNQNWKSLISKIAKVGPSNAAILDTERGIIEKDPNNILVIDESLLDKIKFIRAGSFSKKEGATTLRLAGNITPINAVEVTRVQKKSLIEQYPLTFRELEEKIKQKLPHAGQQEIYLAIRENDLKNNKDYSAYNFRSKKHEKKYLTTGDIPTGTPSIYNQAAVDLIIKALEQN